jgi:endonuclease YncB( thermonuclease family)
VTYVVDGDTVHLACPGTGEVKARLLGFDTPEVYSPGCRRELAAGQQATAILRKVLRSGPITAARFQGHDRYGRELVQLEVNGQDIAGTMIAAGYAVPYSGGRSPDWCRML